jgi:hypothetical protein
VYGAITTHELCPPNPKELEIAAATQQGKKQGENEIFGDLKFFFFGCQIKFLRESLIF